MTASCLFLGTGASLGIPMPGCHCPRCRSTDLKDHRLRCSVLLKIGEKNILIDTSPDFRFQALRIGLEWIDGLIWTHAHNDHTAGIDDLRSLMFKRKEPLPCLLPRATFKDLKRRYDYLIEGNRFAFTLLSGSGEVQFLEIPIEYLTYTQAKMEVMGYKIGTFAYVTDLKEYDRAIFDQLKGVKTLVMSAVRYEPSDLHLSLDEAIAFARRTGAEMTYFSHISHHIGHAEGSSRLPRGFALAFDGLEIPFQL